MLCVLRGSNSGVCLCFAVLRPLVLGSVVVSD